MARSIPFVISNVSDDPHICMTANQLSMSVDLEQLVEIE